MLWMEQLHAKVLTKDLGFTHLEGYALAQGHLIGGNEEEESRGTLSFFSTMYLPGPMSRHFTF